VVYAQFVSFALRVLIFMFSSYLTAQAAAAITSIILILDVLVTLSFYFVPKIIVAWAPYWANEDSIMGMIQPHHRRRSSSGQGRGSRAEGSQITEEENFENLHSTLDKVSGLLVSAAVRDLMAIRIHHACGNEDSEEGRALGEKVQAIKETLADISALGKD